MKKISLGLWILIGVVVGIALGLAWPKAALALSPVGEAFLRFLKMLMVPLVFFSVTSGVCKMGDIRRLRTVGLRFVLYIVLTSGLCALAGAGFGWSLGIGSGTKEFVDEGAKVAPAAFSFVENAIGWVPENVVQAMANANMMQIIVFSLFLGVALLSLGEKAKRLVTFIEDCNEAVLKITDFVMRLSPVGIGALTAVMVVTIGGATAREVVSFVVADNVCCLLALVVLYPLLVALLTRRGVVSFARQIVDPVVVAFTTASSAATLPVSIRTAKERLGIPEDVYGFTLPLGNTCGMNGFAVYIGMVCIFAFNLYGLPITLGAVARFVFLGIVLSIGAAGVKGAGIVMTTVLLESLGLPLGVVPIIAAVWPALDPMHTVLNNVSDLTGTTIVSDRLS